MPLARTLGRLVIRQMSVMNRAYRRTPFKFRLSKITRTTNDKWFRMDKDTAEERDAENKLHSGGVATMNVYVTGTKELLGWAVFPDEARREGKQDGIVVNYGTLPGGTNRPYHLGDTRRGATPAAAAARIRSTTTWTTATTPA